MESSLAPSSKCASFKYLIGETAVSEVVAEAMAQGATDASIVRRVSEPARYGLRIGRSDLLA